MIQKKQRNIDHISAEVSPWMRRRFVFFARRKISTWIAILVIAFVAGCFSAAFFMITIKINTLSEGAIQEQYASQKLMTIIKTRGCVADGILSDYGEDRENSVALLDRSQCIYVHRALETWADRPDFDKADEIRSHFSRKNIIFGMFLAEALNPKKKFVLQKIDDESGEVEEETFSYGDMCREGTIGYWGGDTCVADLKSKKYARYLEGVMKEAIDRDIRVFLLGQVHLQEGNILDGSRLSDILKNVRKYAFQRGKDIAIGAQTNTITDSEYLQQFDFIEGGVGINDSGEIEESRCSTYWAEKRNGWCWALLWHSQYANAARAVLLHLDWSGISDDDMSRFARMEKQIRVRTLITLYDRFTQGTFGFLPPFFAVVAKDNGSGCFGPTPEFYSPDVQYSCGEEKEINGIFVFGKEYRATTVAEKIPEKIKEDESLKVRVTVRNTGTLPWLSSEGVALVIKNIEKKEDSSLEEVIFPLDEEKVILPGEIEKFSVEIVPKEKQKQVEFRWQMRAGKDQWFGEESAVYAVAIEES